MESESNHFITEGMDIIFPQFVKEVIANNTKLARHSNDISQRSGVSVRVSISNFENVLSNASRRAMRLKERQVAPRGSDLPSIIASTRGKIELDTVGDVKEERVVQKPIKNAILEVFNENFEVREVEQLVAGFERGLNVQVGDDLPSMEYVNQLAKVGGLSKAVDKLNGRGSPASIASSIEFILEGLHLNRRLNKDEVSGKIRYRRYRKTTMFERFFKNRYGYSRWDGTQRIEGLDADEILKALSDDYLEKGNLQQALKRLMQEGIHGDEGRRTMGLRELMERMREQRNQQLNRYNMASGVMDDLREKLEEIKQLERDGIQHRLDGEPDHSQQQPASQGQQDQQGQQQSPGSQSQSGQEGQSGSGDDDLTPEQKRKMLEMIAKRKQDYLDKLPADIPGQIKGLSEYDFMDDEAREKFKELMDSLQQQMMKQFFPWVCQYSLKQKT